MSATTQCPHCGAANPFGSQFCQTCGKALPSVYQSGPRVVGSDEFAATAAGQKLQSDELLKQSKKATGALLTVAILQTLGAAFLIYLLNDVHVPAFLENFVRIMAFASVAIAALFWGLWFWSRSNPFPAAIVGTVLYVTFSLVDYIGAFMIIEQNRPPGATGGTPGIPWLKILIIAVLVQACQAGAKHRKLMQQQPTM